MGLGVCGLNEIPFHPPIRLSSLLLFFFMFDSLFSS